MSKSICLQCYDEVNLMLFGSGGFAAVSLNKNDFFFHWALLPFLQFVFRFCPRTACFFYKPFIFLSLLAFRFSSFARILYSGLDEDHSINTYCFVFNMTAVHNGLFYNPVEMYKSF